MTALFRDNYLSTIELLTKEQRKQIKENTKDYIIIDVQYTNNGAFINLDLTNDFDKHEEKFRMGECCIFDNDSFEELIDNYEYMKNKKFYL